MDDLYADAGLRLFENMLARTHTSTPSSVGDVIAEELERTLDARTVVIYLINLEQTALVPLPRRGLSEDEAQDVDGSMVGRSYTSTKILSAPGSEAGRVRFCVPIVDGTDRLGTLRAELPVAENDRMPEDLARLLERYGHATAQVLLAKRQYGDALHRVERSRPLDLGAELLAAVLPPATFATDGLVISAMVQPAYENGGDAYDYAVNDATIHLAVFDAVGHGLHAARMSTFAVAVYRNCRRTGQDLLETYATMNAALAEQFGRDTFTTGILSELDPETGVLRWVSAGHPSPLLVRANRNVKVARRPARHALRDADVRHGADDRRGASAARGHPGAATPTASPRRATHPDPSWGWKGSPSFCDVSRLLEQPPPETLRRLRRALAAADGPMLRDDATVLRRLLAPRCRAEPVAADGVRRTYVPARRRSYAELLSARSGAADGRSTDGLPEPRGVASRATARPQQAGRDRHPVARRGPGLVDDQAGQRRTRCQAGPETGGEQGDALGDPTRGHDSSIHAKAAIRVGEIAKPERNRNPASARTRRRRAAAASAPRERACPSGTGTRSSPEPPPPR